QLQKLLRALQPGDTLVVSRLDRLGRSLSDLIQRTQEIEQSGAHLKSLTETIDTTTATGRLVFHLLGSLAEFERNLT
ncbi:recombinase family protein, partial [Klebsiella pneumoniae]|uniref:recombinase family protein n=1 Tax=Klebsiella pneumoniae TaxID=573 RepID=UPI001B8C8DFB